MKSKAFRASEVINEYFVSDGKAAVIPKELAASFSFNSITKSL